ncbi:RHS repeat domain-containing protein, partial [Prevotella jejuni]|uniref:RHS repeat domain-containing protein n=1 Tax=Prevotella jejuni TaxID=1177574 RepID=UPI003C74D468
NLRNLHGGRQFIPFRQLGQYEDEETGLYYNRFRYYASRLGNYISQDPIRLAGNNPTLYGYVKEPNSWVDVLGLQGVGVPFQVGLHEDFIRINAGTGLDSHHVGQKSCNGQISEKLRCNKGSSNSCSFGWSYKN